MFEKKYFNNQCHQRDLWYIDTLTLIFWFDMVQLLVVVICLIEENLCS